MIATIAEKKKFSDRSDHMETGLYCSLLLSCPFPSKPGYKFGFRSFVQKNGLPGEGRHEGLVPRNDVLTNVFIGFSLACSRLQDGGGKSFSKKKCEKRKSCASYFRFVRFNTFPL